MKRVLLYAGLAVVALVAACAVLLPERYAVNVPLLGTIFGAEPPPLSELQRRVRLPAGFEIELFADGIRNARFLRFAPGGELLVSSPRLGSVFAVEPDRDGDGRGDAVRPVLEQLDRPHGLELRDGWLYVAEGSGVRRVRLAEGARAQGELEPVISGLPDGGNHWTRSVRFGPDGRLYVSVGSSCNVCLEDDPRRAAILRYQPDGSGEEIFAQGLRNAVGLDFDPASGELWVTDNGRDLLGDDFPPCELNRVVRGGFYGWPFVNGEGVADPDFGERADPRIARSVSPAHSFVAHTAPLGITFYRGRAFPETYRGAAFVAQHGSWNRTRKSGYRVVLLEWDEAGRIRESDFAVGFEQDEDVIGRPVDVAEGPDGALYVSDDFAGAIYRIRYAGE